MLSAAKILEESDKKVVGKTIKEVVQQQFGFKIVFTDGTSCEIWSNPDDEIFLKVAA